MAISIDYLTRIIHIPKADLTLIQSSPNEIRELDINFFRLTLKDLEDDEQGMPYVDTHIHTPPVDIGGVTLARVVELINGYTVEFEDDQYAVNITGGNSNIGDRVQVNQVSVRSANSAGLVQTTEIEFASFEGGVWVDVVSGTSGSIYPTGTARQPVDNFADALLIANYRGLGKFYVLGNATVGNSLDFTGFQFVGESQTKSTITLDPSANVLNCEFYDASILGTLDGNAKLRNCQLSNLNFVTGFVEQCVLSAGTIVLGGGSDAHFLDCWSGVPGVSTPTIDLGGTGQGLALRNYNGGITLTNKTGADAVSIDMDSGQIILNSSVTNGDIVCRGEGKLTDNSVGANVIDEMLNNPNIAKESKDVLLGTTAYP